MVSHPLDAGRVAGMEEHVHAGQGPCGTVHLLAIEGEAGGAHRLGCLDRQGARIKGRTQMVPGLGAASLARLAASMACLRAMLINSPTLGALRRA